MFSDVLLEFSMGLLSFQSKQGDSATKTHADISSEGNGKNVTGGMDNNKNRIQEDRKGRLALHSYFLKMF